MRTAVAVVLTAALALCASADGAPASESAEPGASILFGRGADLFLASSDGKDVRRLTRRAGQPSVSADGEQIAFVRNRSIWIMRRDGSHQRRLTSGHEDSTPAWSPDGRAIYFARQVEGKDELGGYEFSWPLFGMNADGSGVRRLTTPEPSDHGTCHESPAVSPSGREIAFTVFTECDRGIGVGISAVDPRGRPVSLARFDLRDAGLDPAWAPDGRSLAFTTANEWEGRAGVAVARADGSRAILVYRRPAAAAAWSPDGRWIAFVRTAARTGTIWLVRPDGTGLRRLSSRRYDSDPAWLPAAP